MGTAVTTVGNQWAGIPYRPEVTMDLLKNGVLSTATEAAESAKSSIGKSIFLLDGSWCSGAIKQFKDSLPKNTFANRMKNLFTFDWSNAINNEYIKSTTPSMQNTAPKGILGKIGHCLGKIPGMNFIKKYFGPLVILGTSMPAIWKGFKEGGIGEGLKEIARVGLLQVSYTATMFIAGTVLGFTGLPLMLAGIGGSMLLGMLVDKILGKSLSEQEEVAQTQNNNSNKNSAMNHNRNGNNLQMTRSANSFINYINQRNKNEPTLQQMPTYYS